jgi:acetoin utilization deacetylase AcuC-like enzyme
MIDGSGLSARRSRTPYGTGVPPLWLRHDASLAHDIPGHPERPDRIRALEAEMARHDWFGAALVEAPEVDRELLQTVHPERYVTALEEFCARGGGFLDADTAAVPATFEAAMRAAGGAAALVDGLLGGTARVGVSALRPPGHHAEPSRAMGFCFFGNVAVGARRAIGRHGLSRVLILDWDVHHGNGTEAIFAPDPEVLFVSIHEWPLYPGTGPASYVGEGAGEGWTVNLPVPGSTGDAAYRSLVAHVVAPLVAAWEPELVLVSAGFDAHHADPLATCTVTEAGFAGMTTTLRAACDAIGVPLGLVLEGGYDLGALAGSMAALMPVLVDESTPDPGVVERHPLAADALVRLEPYWPGLRASASG